ncbi:MAG: SCO family protein [Polyangiaceae bacterium]|nr:SCO family protein [Polyangiaceae bacterium]
MTPIERRRVPRRAALLAAGSLALGAGCARRSPPPDFGALGDFALTDQDGRGVTAATLRGRVWVAAFMFTRCPKVCPRMTARMKELQRRAAARGIPLQLVSISVDNEHDTPERLRAYATEHGADLTTWAFLTGDHAEVKRTSVEGFKLALDGKLDPAADHFGLLHATHLVLVDRAGHLRGYFRTTDDVLDELLEAARAL